MSVKIKDVINGDFRMQGIEEATQYWLLKIEVLNKRTVDGEKVDLDNIEMLIHKLCSKYKMDMQWIYLSKLKGEIPWYTVSFKDATTHAWLVTLYGMTLYELMSKSVLYLYAKTRKSE